MMTFAFPEKDAETFDDDFETEKTKKKNKKSKVKCFQQTSRIWLLSKLGDKRADLEIFGGIELL